MQKDVLRALEFLRGANQALHRASEEQALLADICRIAVETGGYRFAWVGYAQDDAEKSVRFMACAGHHPDYLKRIRIAWSEEATGQGPAGIAIRTDRPAVIQHIRQSPVFSPWHEPALEYGYESVIALPLSWQGQAFGCLAILAAEADAFDTTEAALLQEMAASLSYGIHALRAATEGNAARKQLTAERDTQEVLHRILSLSLERISLAEKLDRALDLLFGIPWLTLQHKGSVFLVEEGDTALKLVGKRHLSPDLVERCARVPFGVCLCGQAAQKGELLFHSHLDHDHHIRFPGIQDHGHYCQPIRSGKGVIGLLNLYVAPGHEPKPMEAAFLGAVADALAGIIERERGEMARQRLVTILEATPDLVTITDTEGNCLYCNEGARGMLGTGLCRNLCSRSILDHYPDTAARLLREQAYPNAIAAGLWEGESTLMREDGVSFPVSQIVMAHRDTQGQVAYISTIARDISDRKRAEEAAQAAALRAKKFANILIDNLPGIFYLVDGQGRFLRWNGNLERILGLGDEALRAMRLQDIVAPLDWPSMEEACAETLRLGHASMEIALRARSGVNIPFSINGIRIDGSETGTAIAGLGIDISDRKRLESELRRQAATDPLTGISNRLEMEEILERELARTRRQSSPLSVAMFDIDHFKQVNDRFGHDAGDEVLKQVVASTLACLRETDSLARWGGEEFLIAAPDTECGGFLAVAERVRQAIAAHGIEGVGHVTISFGVGQYRLGESRKDFLKRVDDALYAAKQAGRNQVRSAG